MVSTPTPVRSTTPTHDELLRAFAPGAPDSATNTRTSWRPSSPRCRPSCRRRRARLCRSCWRARSEGPQVGAAARRDRDVGTARGEALTRRSATRAGRGPRGASPTAGRGPPAAAADRADQDGAAAPRYDDRGLLGRGGRGEVRRVYDHDLGRTLAMKLIGEAVAASPGAQARFVEEAQILARLQHPGIVPVYELGRLVDGRLYFTMQEIHGATSACTSSSTTRSARAGGLARLAGAAPPDRHVPPGVRRGGLRPRARRDPPRPQARQHHARQRGAGAGGRLGDRQDARRGRAGAERRWRATSRAASSARRCTWPRSSCSGRWTASTRAPMSTRSG
jgi:hypothetical protein